MVAGMTPLILWLLLLVKIGFAAVVFHPNTSTIQICAGGDFILTCKTDTGTLVWNRVGEVLIKTFSNALSEDQHSSLGDHITVYLTNVSGSDITSEANITGAPVALNGTVIQCRDKYSGGDSKEKVIFVSDRISAPRNLSFTALNFTTASIEWAIPSILGPLVEVYHIQIFISHSNNIITSNLTLLATSVNVTGLSQGVEYNVTVLLCRCGEKATLLMTLDVPEQASNLAVVSLPEDKILTSWQQPPSSSRPHVMYYAVQHNVSTDTDDGISQVNTTMTNITIDGAQPGHVYYIEVTAVNILGPGPPTSTFLEVPDIFPFTTILTTTYMRPMTNTLYYNSTGVDTASISTTKAKSTMTACTSHQDNDQIWSWIALISSISWVMLLVMCVANFVVVYHYCALKKACDQKREAKCEPENEDGYRCSAIYDELKLGEGKEGGEDIAMGNNVSYSIVLNYN